MFLKSLEIQGFKSFADKVHFDFSPGVTAIVGPNGSGKSNVVDAIRWVLGEQSARTLRGARMEDIIFSGSVDRRPVGMARVTMVLDNSTRIFPVEYDEVEVTRILHRSGDSTYQLNKSNCRLKDIHELFMDTGLGKDGFSVIGQGKIEEILTLRAEDRRGLIEEAAGISKYKYRKIEAERKLAATNDDMTRLDDLLYELEERVEPLSIQAEKVQKYRVLKEEELAIQLAFLSKKYLEEKEIYEEQLQEVHTVHQNALEMQTKIDSLDASLIEKKVYLDKKRSEVEGAQHTFVEILRTTEEYEKQVSVLEERSLHAQNSLHQLDDELQHYEKQKETDLEFYRATELTLAAFEEDLKVIEREIDVVNQEVVSVENEYQTHHETIKKLQQQQFETFSKQATNNNERTRLTQELAGDQARRERVNNRLNNLEKQLSSIHESFKEHQKKNDKIKVSISQMTQDILALADRISEEDKQKQVLQLHLQEKEQKRLSDVSRLETLKEFEEGGEGYFQGVQAVLKAKKNKQLNGVYGSVLQLLDIPNEYLAAIDNTLGSAAQNIIVENDQDAQRAIRWLKAEKRGRATFMPLNIVKGRKQQVEFNNDAVIGLALDLVQYDAIYEPAMAQLLGHVWVLKDLSSATAIAKKTGSKYRFVTLDGDVIAPGGSMTGGHSKKRSSIVFRKNEMSMLKSQIERFQSDIEILERDVAKAEKSIEGYKAEIQEKQNLLQEMRLHEHESDVLMKQLSIQLERIQNEVDFEKLNKQELHDNNTRFKEQLDLFEKTALEIEVLLKSIDADLKENTEKTSSIENKRRHAMDTLQNKRIEEAALSEKYQTQKLRFIEIGERRKYTQEQCKQREHERELVSESLQKMHLELETYRIQLADALKEYKAQEDHIAEDKNRLISLEEEVRQLEQSHNDLRKNNEQAWRSYNKLTSHLERCEERLENITSQLQEVFQFTPDEAIQSADLELDVTNANVYLKNIRRKIDELGEINFTALEEYQSVKERVTFLDVQLKDLHAAKEKLETIIRDMETTMAENFKITYEKVNEKFLKIFTAMFNGGQAHLELSIPGRYLETGVEIIAQPPGKKERVLTLLSGGERALTATALLFALLEVRPSPFVILDEIEAALDEANVERFAEFIKEYAQRTQFIVISHRKGTMEAASVLYGITMDNNGVSKQVSVRLTDYLDEEG